MKPSRGTIDSAEAPESTKPSASAGRSPRKHKRLWRWLVVLLIIAGIGVVGRLVMPSVVRDYVNRTLDRNPMYHGSIGLVTIHLWRGAYSIQDVTIAKATGNVPVPLFAAKQVDFALQWNALLHHRVVGRVLMQQPELNFVDAPTERHKLAPAVPGCKSSGTSFHSKSIRRSFATAQSISGHSKRPSLSTFISPKSTAPWITWGTFAMKQLPWFRQSRRRQRRWIRPSSNSK